jgi:hypothetical protein
VRPALLVIAALLLVAVGVQVTYARSYATNATMATKVVWGVNIALLVALLVGLVWYAFRPGVN